MPEAVPAAGKILHLNGMGLRTKLIFKVYVAGLYLETPTRDAATAIASDQVKRVELRSSPRRLRHLLSRPARQDSHVAVIGKHLLQVAHPLRGRGTDHRVAVQVVDPEPRVDAAVVAQRRQPLVREVGAEVEGKHAPT